MPTTADMQQIGGEHYTSKRIQPWAAMEAWMSAEEFRGFLKGNAIKYFDKVPDANKEEFTTAATELLEGLLDRANGQTPTLSSRTAELIKIMVGVTSTLVKGALH